MRKAFIYLSYILLVFGVIAFIVGLYFIRVEGFKVYYKDLALIIPVYEVSTKWPGNYSEVVNIPIYIVEVRDRLISETWNYTYSISIPWGNCTGGKDICFALRGYRSLEDVPPYVAIEVYGCANNMRQLLLSSDTISLSDLKEGEVVEEGGIFHGKLTFNLSDSILNYKHLNIIIKPANGLVIDYLKIISTLTCSFNYTLPFPINYVKKYSDFYHLHFPEYIDTSGLLNGLYSSLIGLLLILLSIYLRTASTSKQPSDS